MGLVQTTAPICEPVTLATAKAHCRYEGTDENDLVTRCIQAARGYVEDITGRQLIYATWTWTLDEFPDNDTPLYFPRNPISDVAQESRATPATVEVDDVFKLSIGAEVIASFTATAATVANVTAGLTAAWNASVNPAATAITATDKSTYVRLVGDVKNVSFTVTGSTVDGGGNDTQTLTITTPTVAASAISSIKYIDTSGTTQTWSNTKYDVDTSSIVGRVMPAYGEYYPVTRSDMDAVTITFIAGQAANPEEIAADDVQAMCLLIGHWFENREAIVVGATSKPIELAVKALVWKNRVEIV